jgi:TonB family protein
MFEKSTLFSFSGSFVFHLAFVALAGNYMLSDPPPPPPKKTYRLEVIKKKPPVEKKKIREKKVLKRKIPKPLKPIKQPKAVMKQEPLLMAKVMPTPVPQIRPMKQTLLPVTTPVTTIASTPMTTKVVAAQPRRVQPVTQTTAVSSPVASFQSTTTARPLAFKVPQAIHSAVTTNNEPTARASSIVPKSTKRITLAAVAAPRVLSSPKVSSSSSKRSAWVSKNVQRVALPQAVPQKMGSLEEENKGPGKIALVDTKRIRAFSLPKGIPMKPKSFGTPASKGTRTAYFEGGGQRVLLAAMNPRAVPNFTDEGALRGYKNRLGRTIARNKKYPKLSRRKREEGRVVVKFNILRNGEIENLDWVTKSPYERLNQEAFNAVKRSVPFAELPSEIPGPSLQIELPFSFKLN